MFFDFIDLDCPICGKKKGLEQQWYFNSHGDVKFVWKCNNCGAKSDSYEVVPYLKKLGISTWKYKPNKSTEEIEAELLS